MAITIKNTKRDNYEYIPVSERDSDKPTKFIFKFLSKENRAKLEDKLVYLHNDNTINIANASYILNVVKMCLVKVENLLDEDGKEVKIRFSNGLVANSFIELIPDEVLAELGQTIISISKDPENADMYLGLNEKGTDEEINKTTGKETKGK